jgi:hypothetical protein
MTKLKCWICSPLYWTTPWRWHLGAETCRFLNIVYKRILFSAWVGCNNCNKMHSMNNIQFQKASICPIVNRCEMGINVKEFSWHDFRLCTVMCLDEHRNSRCLQPCLAIYHTSGTKATYRYVPGRTQELTLPTAMPSNISHFRYQGNVPFCAWTNTGTNVAYSHA